MKLSDPITTLKGVGSTLAEKLGNLGITTIAELIDNYPRRYDDYSIVTSISRARPGPITIQAVIKQVKGRYVRRGMHITEAVASDDTDSVRIIWFNQPYREGALKPGAEYYISGQYELSRQRFSIINPSIELTQAFPINTARIVPVYREVKGLSSFQIRRLLREAIPLIQSLPETLPTWLVDEQGLLSRAAAMEAIHFPKSSEDLAMARRRLGYEEVFALSLASLLNRNDLKKEHSVIIPFDETLARSFVGSLPFELTDSQRKVVWRIYQDLQHDHPMNRMVEGDVGSGKTVVAAMAALMVLHADYQTAFMAPTEILARQHAETIYTLLKPLGLDHEVDLLVGSMTPAQKAAARDHLRDGSARFVIGTHALIEEKVDMHKLGLVIVDEQQRFGVDQRKKLMTKAGHMPHVLSLTATPIPRTLALTLYGELDISILAEKPKNRLPIITEICSPNSRKQLYEKIDRELEKGRQMFVVCPLISDSAMVEANSVEKIYDDFAHHSFKHRRVGLLHGKLKGPEKNQVMEDFLNHKLDILVSTTVIEVGVDVPNATVMLVEAAERFGLAQLHQLRGRVGRSHEQGYCYLMMSDSAAPSPRLRALVSSNDGFKLAELDLQLRGPGAIYGTMQHGQLDLRIAKLDDAKLIASAQAGAQAFIDKKEQLRHYKELLMYVTRLRAVTNLN